MMSVVFSLAPYLTLCRKNAKAMVRYVVGCPATLCWSSGFLWKEDSRTEQFFAADARVEDGATISST